ncbi:MAG: hypothetical protein ACLP9L_02560 [Thermoguttaceae bacterium]
MASSTVPRQKTWQSQLSRSWAAARGRQVGPDVAIRLLVAATVGLMATVAFGQTESPPQPADAIAPQPPIPLLHYNTPQVPAKESVGPPPAGNAAKEVIPVPPGVEDLLGAPITTLTTDIRIKENPRVPNDVPRSEVPARLLQRGEMSYVMHRPGSAAVCYMWDAPATFNNPLYFEDANLERHGYSLRYLRVFQPIVSGAEFVVTVPTLPYQLTAMPPCECVYTLGEYRPGDCVPYQINYPPFSAAGGLAEAGTAVGLAFLIP